MSAWWSVVVGMRCWNGLLWAHAHCYMNSRRQAEMSSDDAMDRGVRALRSDASERAARCISRQGERDEVAVEATVATHDG